MNPPSPPTVAVDKDGDGSFELFFPKPSANLPPEGVAEIVSVSGGPTENPIKLTSTVKVMPAPSSTSSNGNLALTCPAVATVEQAVTCNIKQAAASKQAPAGSNSMSLTIKVTGDASVYLPDPATVNVDKSGNGSFELFFPKPSANLPSDGVAEVVGVSGGPTENPELVKLTSTIMVMPAGTYSGGEIIRLVGGGAEAFAPGIKPVGKLFANFFLEWGLGCAKGTSGFCKGPNNPDNKSPDNDKFGSPNRYWLQAGLMSTTQAASKATSSSFSTGTLTGFNAQSIESFELRTGISRRLADTAFGLNGIPHGTSQTVTEFIAGLGFTTPVSTTSPPNNIYCLQPGTPAGSTAPNSTCTALSGPNAPSPPPVGDKYIVVYPLQTKHFNLNWQAGFRFQTFYQQNIDSNQPALTDVTFGQDQGITGSKLYGMVLHFEGFWPLPRADFIFLIFGGSYQFTNRGFTLPALTAYAPVSSSSYTGPLTGPNFTAAQDQVLPSDAFRVGLAVDIVDLIKNHLFPKGQP